jgi:phospholipid/cholesterol/gamma-HCH transport system ATP-binding protein
MRSTTPILEIENAQVGLDSELGITTPMSLRLMPGECALIEAAASHQLSAFADLCIGLGELRSGRIRFIGRDWSGLPHDYAGALRSRIGRFFTAGCWLPFLSVESNVLLPALYHTHRSQDELRREALALAQELGLPGLPVGYPDELDEADLRRAALVRALLGEPLLVLLEEPIEDPLEPLGRAVLNRAAITRDRGGAVAWLTLSRSLSADPSFPASQRLRLGEQGLTPLRLAA